MGNTFEKRSITTEYALALVAKAEAKAKEIGVPSVIVVADESGVVKLSSRMDGAGLASIQVATDKAYSAAVTQVPTDMWREISAQDEALAFGLTSIERLCPIGGGRPIVWDGEAIGGFGVSGGTVDQDMTIVDAALGEADG